MAITNIFYKIERSSKKTIETKFKEFRNVFI